MAIFDWELFCRQWSRDLLERLNDEVIAELPPEVMASGWLGYPGATDSEIAGAERRLGCQLPASYKAFLKVSNGWRQVDDFIDRLWSTDEVDQFAARHQDVIEAWTASMDTTQTPSVPDATYFIYGEGQDTTTLRVEYLQTALEVGNSGNNGYLLLIPRVMIEQGEWEGWFLANWLPGAQRYRSFQELIQATHRSFLEVSPKLRELPQVPSQ